MKLKRYITERTPLQKHLSAGMLRGEPQAQYSLGVLNQGEINYHQRYCRNVLDHILRAAEQGYPEALYWEGCRVMSGWWHDEPAKGAPDGIKLAIEMIRRAAKKGHWKANVLAHYYGRGVHSPRTEIGRRMIMMSAKTHCDTVCRDPELAKKIWKLRGNEKQAQSDKKSRMPASLVIK